MQVFKSYRLKVASFQILKVKRRYLNILWWMPPNKITLCLGLVRLVSTLHSWSIGLQNMIVTDITVTTRTSTIPFIWSWLGFLNVKKSPKVDGCFSLKELPKLTILHFLWRLWPKFLTKLFSKWKWPKNDKLLEKPEGGLRQRRYFELQNLGHNLHKNWKIVSFGSSLSEKQPFTFGLFLDV